MVAALVFRRLLLVFLHAIGSLGLLRRASVTVYSQYLLALPQPGIRLLRH